VRCAARCINRGTSVRPSVRALDAGGQGNKLSEIPFTLIWSTTRSRINSRDGAARDNSVIIVTRASPGRNKGTTYGGLTLGVGSSRDDPESSWYRSLESGPQQVDVSSFRCNANGGLLAVFYFLLLLLSFLFFFVESQALAAVLSCAHLAYPCNYARRATSSQHWNLFQEIIWCEETRWCGQPQRGVEAHASLANPWLLLAEECQGSFSIAIAFSVHQTVRGPRERPEYPWWNWTIDAVPLRMSRWTECNEPLATPASFM